MAVLWVGAGVDAEAAVGVAPRTGADGEADVGEGVAGEEDGSVVGKLIEESAAGPDRAGGEQGVEDVHETLKVVRECGQRRCLWWDGGWVGARVVLHLPGVNFHGGLGVEEGFGAGEWVSDGFDGGILAVGVVVRHGGRGEDGRGDEFGGGCGSGLGEVKIVRFESRVGEGQDGRAEVVEEWGGGGGVDKVRHCTPEVGGGYSGDGFEGVGSGIVVNGLEKIACIFTRRGVAIVVYEGAVRAALPLSASAFRDGDLKQDVVGGGVHRQKRSGCSVFRVEIETHRLLGVLFKNLCDGR